MTEIKEYTSDVQSNPSNPYTIDDWHREYDGKFYSDDVDFEELLDCWAKWYIIPGNNIEDDLPMLTKLNKNFKELNVELKKILGEK